LHGCSCNLPKFIKIQERPRWLMYHTSFWWINSLTISEIKPVIPDLVPRTISGSSIHRNLHWVTNRCDGKKMSITLIFVVTYKLQNIDNISTGFLTPKIPDLIWCWRQYYKKES
jgi:hypothetical protein